MLARKKDLNADQVERKMRTVKQPGTQRWLYCVQRICQERRIFARRYLFGKIIIMAATFHPLMTNPVGAHCINRNIPDVEIEFFETACRKVAIASHFSQTWSDM